MNIIGSRDYVAIEVEDFGHGIPRTLRTRSSSRFLPQGSRQGHRSRPCHGLWHRKADRGYVFCSSTVGKGPFLRFSCPLCSRRNPCVAPVEQAAAPARSHRPWHDPPRRGRGGVRLLAPAPSPRGLHSAAGASASRRCRSSKKTAQDRSCRVRRRHAGDGWPTMFGELRRRGVKQGHFRIGLREDAFAKNCPTERILASCQTLQSEAIDRAVKASSEKQALNGNHGLLLRYGRSIPSKKFNLNPAVGV